MKSLAFLVTSALLFFPASRGTAQGADTIQIKSTREFSVRVRRDAKRYRGMVAAPIEDVWSALPETFKEMGFPGGPSTNRAERLYLTRPLTIRGRLYNGEANSNYLDCGRTSAGQLAADFFEVTFAILAWVAPNDSGTAIDVVVDGTARDRTQSSNAVTCNGTGKVEAALIEQLKARVARRAGRGP